MRAMSVRIALRGDDQNPNDEEDAEDFEAEVKCVTIRNAVAAAWAGFRGGADFFFALGAVDEHRNQAKRRRRTRTMTAKRIPRMICGASARCPQWGQLSVLLLISFLHSRHLVSMAQMLFARSCWQLLFMYVD